MKKYYSRKTLFKVSSLLLLTFTLCVMHSCKKAPTYQEVIESSTDAEVLKAQNWYQATYQNQIVNNNSVSKLSVMGNGISSADYTKLTRPDWKHYAKYQKAGKDVVELPIDPSNSIISMLRNKTTNKDYASKKNSRSSFLILKSSKGYEAYVMTIIADSSYLKGDITKLAHNNYNHHDSDFSGKLFYFTPKGRYLNSYTYKNGHLQTSAATATQSTQSSAKVKVNSMADPAPGDGDGTDCTAWYWITYDDYGNIDSAIYLYTTCPEGGGGSPPCPSVSSASGSISVQNVPLPPPDDSGDPDFPPPTDPCNPDDQCTQEAAQFLDDVSQIDSDNTIESITTSVDPNAPNDPNVRTRSYTWTFAESPLGLFKFESTEHATQMRPSQTDKWQFTSFTHFWAGITESLIVGGTFTLNVVEASPTMGTYSAVMALRYNTTSTPFCKISPISITSIDMRSVGVFEVDSPSK